MKRIITILLTLCCFFATFILSANAQSDKITVNTPEFDITINGVKYDNTNTKYPIVVYNDITYLPIETKDSDHNLMSCLGFDCAGGKAYSSYGRLFVKSIVLHTNIPDKIVMPKASGKSTTFAAVISPNNRIIINRFGKVHEIVLKDYPILNIDGTEYLPMTYEIASIHLGLGYAFSAEKGLELTKAPINPRAVTIPEFPITLGGTQYKNEISRYPMLMFNGITYLPLTKGICDYMGITVTYTPETAKNSQSLDVSKAPPSSDTPDFGYISEGDSFSLSIGETFDGELFINGKGTRWHTYGMEYPPFSVGDVWYLPLTWQIAHDYLGWEYSFDKSYGLSLGHK